MALDKTKLANNGMGQGSGAPGLWSYVSATDNKAAIAAADYFLGANDVLKANDVIMSVGSDGLNILRVVSVTSATVTTELLETTTA